MPSGLSTSEVKQRQIQYGKNQLELKNKKSRILSFFEEFKDLMVVILIIATIISFVAGEVKDGSVIAFIVLLNAVIGFLQKYRAEKAVEALKNMLAPQARVIRDGVQQTIPANQLVPGDLMILNEGDLVPADAELFFANELEVQESILTGESMPVSKTADELANTVFMGTIISHGTGRAIVTHIGMATSFGKIAQLTTATEKDRSPLQKELDHVGLFVGKITILIAAFLGIYGVMVQNEPIAAAILFAASVAVAAVPEGLPTTITIALALGVQRLARKNAIVKDLSSVETLGSTTVIVTDKTGTLTKNEMTVQQLTTMHLHANVTGTGYDPKGEVIDEKTKNPIDIASLPDDLSIIRLICTLCNNAKLAFDHETNTWKTLGDPTEGALLSFAQKLGLSQEEAVSKAEIIHEFSFDSKRKRMSVIVHYENKTYILCKGAPDSVLQACDSPDDSADSPGDSPGRGENLSESDRKKILATNEEGAERALRMIGFAYREIENSEKSYPSLTDTEKNLTYLGMVGIIDPPREEVPNAIELARKAGIRIYILTGDHGLTAKAIGEKIGLVAKNIPHRIITGDELKTTSDENLRALFTQKTPAIFARVSPEDKLRIVGLLKEIGEIVAVTGDGVNDAPALKRADIGIAMGIAGTDVSKEAANMVLADDSFSTIVTAIQEGRTIYENLKKFIIYIFSSNIGELFVIFSTMIIGLKSPLSAIMILIINVGTDVFPALALGLEKSKDTYMTKPPRHPTDKILQKDFTTRIFFIGTLIGVTSLIAYMIGLKYYSQEVGMSLTFATLVIGQMFNTFSSRDPEESGFKKPFSNPYLLTAIAFSILLIIAALHLPLLQHYLETTPLTGEQWLISAGLGSLVLIGEEIRKLITRSKNLSKNLRNQSL